MQTSHRRKPRQYSFSLKPPQASALLITLNFWPAQLVRLGDLGRHSEAVFLTSNLQHTKCEEITLPTLIASEHLQTSFWKSSLATHDGFQMVVLVMVFWHRLFVERPDIKSGPADESCNLEASLKPGQAQTQRKPCLAAGCAFSTGRRARPEDVFMMSGCAKVNSNRHPKTAGQSLTF